MFLRTLYHEKKLIEKKSDVAMKIVLTLSLRVSKVKESGQS